MSSSSHTADLHVHTTASDGTVDIGTRIDQAKKADLDAIAITDHDTIGSKLTSRRMKIKGVEVITGVEVRADIMDTKIEILGYYVDPTDSGLSELLKQARQFRKERNDEMMQRLTKTVGIEVSRDTVPTTEGSIGRPHLAKFLVQSDIVSSIQDAFDEYLADDTQCFVPMKRIPSREVIKQIQNAGGITSLAHPGRISVSPESVEEMVTQLTGLGLDAIEVWYPYSGGESRHADIGAETASRLADECDLLRTGGSDCHGPNSGNYRLGEMTVPDDELEIIRNQAKSIQY